MGFELSDLNPLTWPGQVKQRLKRDFGSLTDEPQETKDQRSALIRQGNAASDFASTQEGNYNSMGVEAFEHRKRLQDILNGKDSLSAEQLRQGLQQNLAAQRSMAASAAPRDATMAARTAAMNAGRLGSGMAGQAALAGIQERGSARDQLAQMIMRQRDQDLQAALQGRDIATRAYGGQPSGKSDLEKLAPFIQAVVGGGAALSDERAKRDVRPGDAVAQLALRRLEPKTFAYKDPANGNGRQLGVTAQNLERAGLGHTVVNAPDGKRVDPGKLSTSLAAMMASQERRIEKLESDGVERAKRQLAERMQVRR